MVESIPDKIILHKCASCHGWFQKKVDNQICCSAKCNGIYYANLRKVSLSENKQEPREQTKGEKILAEMRSWRNH